MQVGDIHRKPVCVGVIMMIGQNKHLKPPFECEHAWKVLAGDYTSTRWSCSMRIPW